MANEKVTIEQFLTDKKFKKMSLTELEKFIDYMNFEYFLKLDGDNNDALAKAKKIYEKLHPTTNPATIEKYKSRGQITFRVKSSNGKVLNHKYNTNQGCDKGIKALEKAMSNYKVIDLTKN